MRVAVIGGGPSGLVQLKTLLSAHEHLNCEPFEPRLFEASSKVGGVFHSHVYEDAELVSSKYLTAFSDFRPRHDDADFLSAERYVEYLEEYATHFELWDKISLNTKVINIKRHDQGHVVVYQKPDGEVQHWVCDAIAICSGVHSKPNLPTIPGIENVPTVMHSSDFKTRAQLGKDKTVMVLGSGETGADVSYVSITADTKRVVLCHRSGWVGAPKVRCFCDAKLQLLTFHSAILINSSSPGCLAMHHPSWTLYQLISPRSPSLTPCMSIRLFETA